MTYCLYAAMALFVVKGGGHSQMVVSTNIYFFFTRCFKQTGEESHTYKLENHDGSEDTKLRASR